MRDFVVSRGDELLSILYEWDEEGAGHVTRREFRHSLKMLGLSASKLHLDALCDVVDAARSDLVRISAVQQLVGNTAGIARESAPKRAVHQQHVADAKTTQEEHGVCEIATYSFPAWDGVSKIGVGGGCAIFFNAGCFVGRCVLDLCMPRRSFARSGGVCVSVDVGIGIELELFALVRVDAC
eukprot:5074487-Pleurochrysis_carterae.AAC.1